MTAKDTWAEALFPFFEGKRDQPPDIKALARLLRSKKRLPAGFRDTLAEILDPQLPHKLAVNYGLEPKWRGRNVKTAKEDRIEALVFEKMPGFLAHEILAGDIVNAIAREFNMSERNAIRVWKKNLKRWHVRQKYHAATHEYVELVHRGEPPEQQHQKHDEAIRLALELRRLHP